MKYKYARWIYSIKNLAICFAAEANSLIDYNSNNLEENKEEKEPIDLDFTELS